MSRKHTYNSFSRLLLWMCFVSAVLHSVVQAQQITQLRVEGNVRIEREAIEAVIASRADQELNRNRIKSDIRAVYNLGYFQNVQVELVDGVLNFKVEEKPFVGSVEFSGNKKEADSDLKDHVVIEKNSYFNPQDAEKSVEQLKAYYDSKGGFLTDVTYELKKEESGNYKVRFLIKEYQKIKIRSVRILGNKAISEDEIKPKLFTQERNTLSFLSGRGVFREEGLGQDTQVLRDIYGRQGYLDVEVAQPDVKISQDKESAYVSYKLKEGTRYKIDGVDISGEFVVPKEEFESEISLKVGEWADTSKIQKDIANLSRICADEGYAYANVIPQDNKNEKEGKLSINYVIQPGQKIWVERIEFKGNDSTRDKVLRREMQIVEGDQYNLSKIQQSKANIERLALYEEVRLSTPRGSSDDRVNIVIEVKERQTGSFNIGAGFNTLDSFQIIATIQKRNVFGRGVDLSLDARLGGRVQSFNLRLRDEYFLDSRWGFTLNVFSTQRQFTNFDLTSEGINAGFDYPLYQKGLERIRLGLSYSIINQKLGDLLPTVENVFSGGLTSSVTTILSRDTRNRVFDPSQGSLLRLSQEIAGGYLGGENEFSKTEFDGRWFFPIFKNSEVGVFRDSVFGLHFQTGYVTPIFGSSRVPLFERYFPGGILNIRGFPLRSLGPRISTASSSDPTTLTTSEFVIGGNKQLIFNAEWVFPIIKAASINGVLFFDMGNAFDVGETMLTFSGQRQSVGYGLRWLSPIGPLRFEWGYPLDLQEGESRSLFDFTIGSLF